MFQNVLSAFCAVLLAGAVINAQPQADFEDGTSAVILPQRLAPGPPQAELGAAAIGLSFFTSRLPVFNTTLPITFIGGDPSVPGTGTTTIPTLIVPLRVNFLDGSGFLDATGTVANVIQSPLFTPVDFKAGGTDLGVVQYADAVQRAQFWTYTNPAGVSPNYHVVLDQPLVFPTVTINVPTASGHLVLTRNGTPFGRVDDAFWEPTIQSLLTAIHATPAQMPIFLAMNIGLYVGTVSNCCILGYHNSTSGPATTAQTWIFASWLSSGIFSTFQDVLGLSHEISEWINDPFVGALTFTQVPGINWVPPYVLPGQGGACQVNFETGDAVEALSNGSIPDT